MIATPPQTLTPEQTRELRDLITTNGFLPMTNKADRLFATLAARRVLSDRELADLKTAFREAGYLPRSKALRLVELVEGRA
jgi:hypothetical protein